MSNKSRCYRTLELVVVGMLVMAGVWLTPSVRAQPSGMVVNGKPITPEDMKRMRAEHMKRMQQARSNAGSDQSAKPDKKEKKDDKEKDKDAKKDDKDDANLVKRPTEPPQPANPEELKVEPDANGLVQFSFRGQSWVDVLQWFADVAGYSFDWQELPGGFLNLTTRHKYTLPDTRDLLNRHLLSRGFTMLLQGEVLNVVKIDKIDPSLVPRAEADNLEDYAPYDFMRVTFMLPRSLEPAKAAEDVKILLSPNAKVTPLLASKRLLVLDAVVNLRDVRNLLYAEQMAVDQIIKPIEYRLKYRRADYVADQIMVVLGLDPDARKSPQELQLEQQKMQMMMKMQQKGKDMAKMLQKDAPKVYIAVNLRQNSILVNAPPEMVPTIGRTIELFDQPDGAGGAISTGPLSMKTYKTVTASTDKVIKSLQEIGNLDPLTQLQSDSSSNSIYAYATPADHAKIKEMIGKLDGSGRQAKVIQLRRLPADQIAGTLTALLVGEKKKKEQPRRSFFWGFGRSNEPEKKEVGFQALADVENNRLLLWANESELEEVRKILTQLGEIPSGESNNPNKVRVLDSRDPEATARLLRQLESVWSGKNRLKIHAPPEKTPSENRTNDQPEPEQKDPATPATKQDTLTKHPNGQPGGRDVRALSVQFAALRTTAHEISDAQTDRPTEAEQNAEPPQAEDATAEVAPPIDIVVTPEGRIVLRSDDPVALDELEDLLNELAPPQDEFHVFELKNASPYWVVDYLEQYFEDELKGQKESQYTLWGDYAGSKKKDTGPTSLSKRRLLRFIHDIDTNTIVVQNASPSQLRIIKRLVEVYDQPVSEDSVSTRRTEAIKIRYSRAADIAVALKEVFRDLLSSKDKEFQGKDGQQKSRSDTVYRFYRSGPPDDKNEKKSTAVKIAFEGALSIGVDEISNTLIISTQEEVWEEVRKIVERLDEAARPNTMVHVHKVSSLISPADLQKALSKALGAPWPGGKPQKEKAQAGGKGKGKGGSGKSEGAKGKQSGENG